MPTIQLSTHINAPIEIVFDASRNLDFHQNSLRHTQESIVAGKTSGLLELGETVTWEARHFGFRMKMKVEITALDPPHYFVDEMVKGPFKRMRHEHFFEATLEGTSMTDSFHFESPLGPLGQLANSLVLTSYLKKLLRTRNKYLKEILERNPMSN